MNASSPMHVDSGDLARLKDRFPDLSAIDLPKLENVGRNADQTIDRLLGRSKTPVWAWFATGLGLIAIIGAIATYLWMRRPLVDAVEATLDGDVTTEGFNEPANGHTETTASGYGETSGYGRVDVPVGADGA